MTNERQFKTTQLFFVATATQEKIITSTKRQPKADHLFQHDNDWDNLIERAKRASNLFAINYRQEIVIENNNRDKRLRDKSP